MLSTRSVSPNYARQVCVYCRQYASFAGPFLADLTEPHLNAWIDSLLEAGKSPRTVKAYRASVVSLWRYCYEEGLVAEQPRRIKRVRIPRHPPQAWTREEVQRLLQATGRISHERARWARAYIHVAWCTGLRTGDIFRVRLRDLNDDNTLHLSQAKTGDPHTVTLGKSAIDALREVGGQLKPINRSSISALFRQLVGIAGIRAGTARWLRRSAASYYELEHPGQGERFLGHLTPGLAKRHYLDPSIVGTAVGCPPEL